jgi:hypothetical protein
MDIEEIIQRIVDNGRIEDMKTLSDILEETMELIKRYDPDCYKQYEMELYKMAFGDTLNKEMAEDIVSHMRPYGEHWNIEETMRLQEQRGIHDIRDVDFFVVMNSAYNDYNNIFGDDIEGYIRYTVDFINDEDAKEGKVFIYFTEIPM